MEVKSIKPLRGSRVLITLDTGLSFPLYERETGLYQLAEDKPVAEETFVTIRDEVLIPRAKKRLLYLLQKRDYTEHQLREKLKTDGYPSEVTDAAISYVKDLRYVDDLRYACAYVRLHAEEKSKKALQYALLQKGVPKELIETALEEEYASDEEEQIKKLLAKKHFDPEEADRKEKNRIYQYLLRKGYSPQQIRRFLTPS